jgi:hypothetical protein
MKIFSLFFLLCAAFASTAQVIYTYPLFPTADGNVTIYYDATQGNGALANYNGDLFIHTGVITNLSTSPTDWKHVQTTWGISDPAAKMTPLGNNLFSFSITGIGTYYEVSGSEVIEELAMVFRNATGTIVGRDYDGSDIYYEVWDGTSLQTKLLQPQFSPLFVDLNEQVNSVFVTSKPADITLYQNNNFFAEYLNTDSVAYSFTAATEGKTTIRYDVTDGISSVSDSFYFIVNPAVTVAELPAGTDVGINYVDETTVTLVLVAPNKSFVYAIGDFSNWEADEAAYLNKTPDGKNWWVTLTGLTPQQEYRYQYLVDGNLFIADPYSDKILNPNNDPFISSATYPDLTPYPTGLAIGNVSIFQTGQTPYNWQDAAYVKPEKTELIIYELLLRDFVAAHDFKTLIDTINYLKNLGVNAIELMPFSEFEGNNSWGYNPSFYFAPDKYYGPKEDLKAFIDLCHQNGIAVIQDMVLNHSCSQSPMCQLYWDGVNFKPSADNPWYNVDAKHDFNVCYDFNHDSEFTEKFVDDVLKYWVEEYHIDGFRFDLSKGFTQTYSVGNIGLWGQYDQSRIDNIKRMGDQIWAVDPSAILILEHFADNSEEQVLSSYGFMLWSNSNFNYAQCAMGYSGSSDISWVSYQSHGFSERHAVGYLESHDEERTMYKVKTFGNHNNNYDVRPLDTALNRIKLNACFFFPVPGPKMLWQFGELGYDFSINYCQNGSINEACRVDPKPIKWDYFTYNPRYLLYRFYSILINLKKEHEVFNTGSISWQVGNLYKSMRLSSNDLNVCVLGNFDIVSGNVTPNFQHTGIWYEYFTGDSVNISNTTSPVNLQPGEYRFYTDQRLDLPDLGNVGIEEIEQAGKPVLQCYPNPASEVATADFYVPHSGEMKLELLDLYGRTVKMIAGKKVNAGWFTVPISLNDLSNGMYLLRLTTNQQQTVSRIEVQK